MPDVEKYSAKADANIILELDRNKFREHNILHQKHFDGDGHRNDCYVLHHKTGVTALVYYDVIPEKIIPVEIELVGEEGSRKRTKEDLNSLLGIG